MEKVMHQVWDKSNILYNSYFVTIWKFAVLYQLFDSKTK